MGWFAFVFLFIVFISCLLATLTERQVDPMYVWLFAMIGFALGSAISYIKSGKE